MINAYKAIKNDLGELTTILKELEEDYLDKAYLGIVEDPNDPNKEGRCKIRVFGLHEEEIETEEEQDDFRAESHPETRSRDNIAPFQSRT